MTFVGWFGFCESSLISSSCLVQVILMSATLNGSQFAEYYGGCPVLHIPGFMFPVTAYYLPDLLHMIDYQVRSQGDYRTPPSD
jgi:ATP-dependent RNA helicase DHX36